MKLPQARSLQGEVPGPASRALDERRRKAVPRGVGTMTPVYAAAAHGAVIEDVDGNRFIDFGAGWGTNNLGNTHPEIVGAVEAALRRHGVTCWTSAANTRERIEAAERLLAVCPKRI